MNQCATQEEWQDIKDEILDNWEELTEDELDKTKGNIKVIAGLVLKKYGSTDRDFSEKLSTIFTRSLKNDQEASRNKNRILRLHF